ncbi:unnamed protein product, partial [Discosporangium mesarthrocarpum]
MDSIEGSLACPDSRAPPRSASQEAPKSILVPQSANCRVPQRPGSGKKVTFELGEIVISDSTNSKQWRKAARRNGVLVRARRTWGLVGLGVLPMRNPAATLPSKALEMPSQGAGNLSRQEGSKAMVRQNGDYALPTSVADHMKCPGPHTTLRTHHLPPQQPPSPLLGVGAGVGADNQPGGGEEHGTTTRVAGRVA